MTPKSNAQAEIYSGPGTQRLRIAEIEWYCAVRERYPTKPNDCFAMSLIMMDGPDLSHGGYRIELTDDVKDYVFAKWPNRGDSVLLECLHIDASSTASVLSRHGA